MIKIVTVTPISKGIGKETLAYFTSRDIKVGALVTVPLRNRNVPALVMGVEEVTYSKTDIKAANFKLKKISANKGYALLPSFVRATELTSQYFASKTGAVIEALVPDTILKNPPTIKITETKNADSKNTQIKQERLLLQADDDERTSIYKSLIREEFAKKQSIFLCTPTINDAERIAHILSRGIKEHTYILHSELGKKEILSRWKRVLNSKHPVLIIATGTFLSIPREDIGTIIIEKEHSPSYKISYRPFIDIRTFAEIYTKEQNKRLIFADFKLRAETLYRKERKEFTDFAPLKWKVLSPAKNIFVDMKKDNKAGAYGKTVFSPIGKELEVLLSRVSEHGDKLFAFTSRRGIHPITICNDCGDIVLCDECSAPLVLHRTPKARSTLGTKNIFECHSCRRKIVSRDRCDTCASWRLTPLGAGTEFIEEIIKEKFKNINVFRLDRDTASTRNKAMHILEEFLKTRSSVLVGTELALSFIPQVHHIAVVSCDTLFSIPDFKINERVFAMLLALRAKAEKTFLIQTRMPSISVFKESMFGDIGDFYKEEIASRKKFGYPPFTTLVKLSLTGKKERVTKEAGVLEEKLHKYNPMVFSTSRTPTHVDDTSPKTTSIRILLKVTEKWPDKNLLSILGTLPPSIEIRVDPEDTL